MHIAIRVDASVQIGTGHLMRCLTLANQIKILNGEVVFICRHLPDSLATLVEQNGHTVRRLLPVTLTNTTDLVDSDSNENLPSHAHWLHATWQQDAYATKEVLSEFGELEYLVIDHYALDARWESALRPYVSKIMVIDDLADRQHDCDLLLDQNYYVDQETRYANKLNANTTTLLGPKFALLRPEFSRAKNEMPEDKRNAVDVKRLNICFGGIDATGEILKTLDALEPQFAETNLQVDIVMGNAAPHISLVQERIKKYNNIHLHIAPPNLAQLMATADLGIGAAGSMSWERASLGLPSIAIALADNQLRLGIDAAQLGLHLFLGHYSQVTTEKIRTAFTIMLDNCYLRQSFSMRSGLIVDDKGKERVAKYLVKPKISLRLCQESDCLMVYQWRNAEINRLNSHQTGDISYTTHEAWFLSSLNRQDRYLLIGGDTSGDLGVLRYDKYPDYWMTSVYLVPGRHGHGLGDAFLKAGLDWMNSQCGSSCHIRAEIKSNNAASHAVFKKAGYSPIFTTYTVM
ncbi:MAG: UDP-2,4-diacetamido-2,4,6-trideoxy-beta-L-altropyranose hydrolase [Undibacterium sp.]|uniref:UDP-2,4-diacetamido-2,4, 6-trideoxy-beta-L-altropyranose hydrolase n=1 Tax=Undibacterium sp. TaxID=1914977 RepID=UPI00272172AF|nr:UDP-2,4-diacetamido-2,4,6-trideoxy-beta-L-altropyranose hydrolase [Undibacterium sp.]MDO8651862.1 UDP-2,4-diacetamido-2,4,6-trideoxy-beta-L-altropyranose hydrolase [Undibacterium sp.]